MMPITASMLYDYHSCPHRVSMDLFADPAGRDEVSPFVQLLWERGSTHEKEIIGSLKAQFLDLSTADDANKERLTLEAMKRGEPLIYGGKIAANGLVGIPDLLRRENNGYMAGDIKSGSADEGEGEGDDGKPKVHYAVQVALYTDILEQIGLSAGRRAFIWDVHGAETIYDLVALYGVRKPRSLWQDYEECIAAVRGVLNGEKTLGAYSSACKNCVWYSACLKTLEGDRDLTLIPFLGRALRDTMIDRIGTVDELAEIDPEGFMTDKGKKTVFAGLGPDRLRKFQARAKLTTNKDAKPYLSAPVNLPLADRELFFDIEVDPLRDFCYLHGFVERNGAANDAERFVSFFAESTKPEDERKAFADAWAFMAERQPCTIYYYSKYERSIYRKLRARYPDVCSEADLEALFDPARSIDLYFDVVLKATEWPTRDFSIKSLAKHLGFEWRDTHPSGAASIEWFHRWVETGDENIRRRILDYNEDDCRATRVLLDGIRSLAH